jgi:hypothetical protein
MPKHSRSFLVARFTSPILKRIFFASLIFAHQRFKSSPIVPVFLRGRDGIAWEVFYFSIVLFIIREGESFLVSGEN